MSYLYESSYLTSEEETVSSFRPLRSYDTLVQAVNTEDDPIISYGLFQATCREFGRLLGIGNDELDATLNEPWQSYTAITAPQANLHEVRNMNGVLILGELKMPDNYLRIFGPYGGDPTLNVIVNQMTVQEILSCEKTRTERNRIRVLDRFEFFVNPAPESLVRPTKVTYHLIRFERIKNLDLEIILRAKASESPLLPLESVSMLLNPSVPNVLIRGLRSMNAIVDWSIVQGMQDNSNIPISANPSIQWSR